MPIKRAPRMAILTLMLGVAPALAAQQVQKPLTNADVVKMLRASVSEQIIMTVMRTQVARFDVSKQGRAAFDRNCAATKPAGVSADAWGAEVKDIWDAMTNVAICQRTNGRGGEDTCAMDGQEKMRSGQRPGSVQSVTSANTSVLNDGSKPGSAPASKFNGHNQYESVTLERGVTRDTGFANWVNSGQASTSRHELPALPPIQSNPKRDAADPADAATKAEIKRKLEAQIASFQKSGPDSSKVTIRPAEKTIREVELLKHQKTFVDALRKQGVITPLKADGQLGANSQTMAATEPPQTGGRTLISSAPATINATPSGSITSGSGTLLLNGAPNQTGSKTVAQQQTVTPVGSPLSATGSGTLLLNGATNQAGSKTVAQQQTVTPVGSPLSATGSGTLLLNGATNQAGSRIAAAQHPATPSSPINIGSAAKSLTNVSLAEGSVSGYVLWDTSTVHYQLSTPCQGLQVTISTVLNGSRQTFATSTNFTTPFGTQPVWNYSGQRSQGPWMVCSYAFFKVPEQVPLEVDAVVSQPSAFTTPVSLPPMQKNQFQISGGTCGSAPQSTLALVLTSGSILCGDYAFNVNFAGFNSRYNAALTETNQCFGTQIYTVNGVNAVENASNPVVFTQDPAYNDYIITGCGFGNGEGGQVYLSGAVTGGRINMTVLQWSPTQIEAVVQWGLTGVLDGWPDLVVVPPGGGTPGKFANCRFYAQRQSVLLPNIPLQYAHLDSEQVGDSTHGFGTSYCPGPDLGHLFPCISFNAGPPLDGVSNGNGMFPGPNEAISNAVDRDGGQLQFNSGEDTYDLSNLAPGFVIDYFGVSWYAWSASVCKGWQAEGSEKPGDSIDYSTQGKYGWYLKTSTQIAVDWGVDHCAWRWLGMFNVDDEYNAGYSLEVYVSGPIGVDPWTGQPTARH